MNSDTPRTDALIGHGWIGEPIEVCRTLEREVADRDATIARLREALQDVLEWCENARNSTGIKPYGLDVARAALNQE